MLIDAAYKGEVRTCIVTPINMSVIVIQTLSAYGCANKGAHRIKRKYCVSQIYANIGLIYQ